MTPHQVVKATQEDAEAQLNERLFVVDMSAPVTLLKKQFTEAIEKVEKSKNSFDALAGDWEEFAVLPYIDLQDWCSANQLPLPSHSVQAVLYYRTYESGKYGQKSVGKFTRPHAERMLDTAGAAFNALKIAASAEFTHAIDYAREAGSGGKSQAAEEALVRWFPRTYPDNLTDLKNVGRLLPGNMGAIDLALKVLSAGLAKDCERLSVAERIRQRPKTSERNRLRIMERIYHSND